LETGKVKADFASLLEMTLGKEGQPKDASMEGIEAVTAWHQGDEAWVATETREGPADAAD
jgi:hypothetical protein